MVVGTSDLAAVLKAVADESRLGILRALMHRSLCVCELAEFLGLAMSTVSEHLKVLSEGGLVESRKSGTWVDYSLAKPPEDYLTWDVLELLKRRWRADTGWSEGLRRLHELDRRKILSKNGVYSH